MINELSALGIKILKQKGEYKTTCPQCSHTRKNKRDKCLSVDITNGLYNCHNCGWSGSVQKFSSKPDYIKPLGTNIQLNKRVLNWFEQRKITESTLLHWKIGESLEYMPQVGKKRRVINFNYFRDNELINVKFRDSEKNLKWFLVQN